MSVITHEPVAAQSGAFLARALPDLSAQVAHDLNNHLATMLGKAELALMLDDPGRYRPTIGEILDAGQPARQLVADLQRVLSWARVTAEPVPLGEVLSIIVRLTSRRAERIGIEICARPGPDLALSEQPALITMLGRGLVSAALEESDEEQQTWTISNRTAASGPQLVLDAPGLRWSEFSQAVVKRGAQNPDSADGCLPMIAFGINEIGGKLSLEPGGAILHL